METFKKYFMMFLVALKAFFVGLWEECKWAVYDGWEETKALGWANWAFLSNCWSIFIGWAKGCWKCFKDLFTFYKTKPVTKKKAKKK